MDETQKKYWIFCIYPLLALITLVVYWQLWSYDFINLDDPDYVIGNQQVRGGLTIDGIEWAFTAVKTSNWHPLTWLSLMLDCQLFGTNPAAHHLINLLLHVANTLLLFAILRNMTGALWASVFVAAAFALHPLHVESVAWISERKDVLSTLFWMLTTAAYLRYVKRPSVARYLLTIAAFALGLLAKPMLVTLPFALLLLDYWPLNRVVRGSGFRIRDFGRLIIEKIPLFMLAIVSSAVTFIVQRNTGAAAELDAISLYSRIANAFVSYLTYIRKMIWPSDLAVFYPHPGNLPMWQAAAAAAAILAITILVIRLAKNHRYLMTGWLWYLGTLVPVIGLVQVGNQALADRYSYIPLIGLFTMIAFGTDDLFGKYRYKKIILSMAGAAAICVLAVCTYVQAGYWRNSVTLFEHTLKVTKNNYLAHNNLGMAFQSQGKIEQAISQYKQVLQFKSDDARAHNNLGNALRAQGKFEEANEHYTQAIKYKQDFAEAHNNLGISLVAQGRIEQGINHYRQALRLKPDSFEIQNNLALVLATCDEHKFRNPDEAIKLAQSASRLTGYRNATILNTLAAAYAYAGRFNEAVTTAQLALDAAIVEKNDKLTNHIRGQLEQYKRVVPQK
jgi:tetratricopeptide (TPR) repeat protein